MEKILVALDGSPRADGVLKTASGLAAKTGAKLVLFRAVGLPANLPREVFGIEPDKVGDVLRKQALDYLNEVARHVSSGSLSGVRVDIGSPWRAVCDAADAENVDLVVIGSHGYDAVDRLIGTTASKVVNHSSRSVLVVRNPVQ